MKNEKYFIAIWRYADNSTPVHTETQSVRDVDDLLERVTELTETGTLFEVYRAECIMDRT